MNSFANSLFTLLFGWTRTMIQQIWNGSMSGHFSGFLPWVGEHWLWLVLALMLCGTAVDFLVWLVRWQPYRVWKTQLRKIGRWLHKEKYTGPRRFDKGYQHGIALDMPQQDPPADSGEPGWDEAAWSQEAQASIQDDPYTHSFTEQLIRDADFGGAERERQGRNRQGNSEPPMVTASWLSSAYQRTDAPDVRRKRRSEKYEKEKKPTWTSKLMIPEVEEDSLLDGLPPAVDRAQAFHDPVYPNKDHVGANTGWTPAVSGKPAEGSSNR